MRIILSNFWETILAACVAALCAGVFMQVLLRYAIKVSFPAIEEIVSISFIYTIFLGAAVGMKRMEHLSIDFLLKRVSPGFQKVLRLVVAAGTALFLFFVVREGIGFVRDSYTQTTTYLNLPMSYSYAAIPGSGLIMLYYLAKRTYATIRSGGASAEAEGGHP
jgi:TRAP-type C4-dicarboxylate transport system permease small subunit